MKAEFRIKTRADIPVVTGALVGINIVIWVIMELLGDTQDSRYMLEWGAAYLPYITVGKEWWRIFTCMFLHFGADHLMNNMLILGLTGMRLEHTLGQLRFGVLYLASGMCGSLLSLYEEMHMAEASVSAGASGAVFGVIGGLLAWALLNKGKVEGLSAKGLVGMAALSLYYGFSVSGIDNAGHIGGLAGGFVLGCIFAILSKIVDFRKRKPYTID